MVRGNPEILGITDLPIAATTVQVPTMRSTARPSTWKQNGLCLRRCREILAQFQA